MNPEMMKMLMPFLAGAGLAHFAASVKKLKETMTAAPAGGGNAGPQRQVPPALQAMLQAGQPPAPSASGGPPNLAALAQLLAARGAQ
jgi:hypothetical protein